MSDLIKGCSVCKKLSVGGIWVSVTEEKRQELLWKITHGYCPECYKEALSEMEDFLNS